MVDVTHLHLLLASLVCLATASLHPRDVFKVTATAVLTGSRLHRRHVMATPITMVLSRHSRRVETRGRVETLKHNIKGLSDLMDGKYKRALPLANPHPNAQILTPNVRHVIDGEHNRKQSPSDDSDESFDSEDTKEDSSNFDDEEGDEDEEDENDDEETSPTAAGILDSGTLDTSDSTSKEDSTSSNTEAVNDLTSSSAATNHSDNDTSTSEHYEFNDDDSDDAEDPDDVATPTDNPSRKVVVQKPPVVYNQAAVHSKTAARKTIIEKEYDDELIRLLKLEEDIDDMTKRLPQNKKRNTISHAQHR